MLYWVLFLLKMLKKNHLVIIFIVFQYIPYYSQTLISSDKSYPSEEFSSISLDKSTENIYYNFTYLKYPNDKSSEKTSLTVLEVGENFSKFSDYYNLKLDSIKKQQSSLKRLKFKEIQERLLYKNQIGFEFTVVKNLMTSKVTVQGYIPSNIYEYQIEQPDLKWTILPESKKILGYEVHKATVDYAGRKWICWFTNSIPIPLGPYVFGNLPGLILELYDSDKNFNFVMEGIDQKSRLIYIKDGKKIINVSKKDFLKTNKSYHEQPRLFLKGPAELLDQLQEIKYNPIELED